MFIKAILKNSRKVRIIRNYVSKWNLFRHVSHVTKSRIFKNLNLRKKSDHNFRSTFLKNRFRHPKLYSNPPSWFVRSRCHMSAFWKTKDWGWNFWDWSWNFQVLVHGSSAPKKSFFIILDLGPHRNQKFRLFSMGKSLYKKIL